MLAAFCLQIGSCYNRYLAQTSPVMMALPISKAVVLLLLSVAVCMTAAYPQLYVVRVATEDCLSHPSKALGGHQAPTNSR